ncbi:MULTISPECIES: hypothetical protein [unclassified Nostoc]|uniref:hypothetical protein n=1 Tax=unclassified Nostoc TaxID=2593658 RepID=UPI00263334C2|nr:hypothetical protein [Nostoc sp. S13]MDF5738319.1 hypothetical protein [Nostoc sp. S13]
MSSNSNETLVEQTLTYTLEMNGKFYLIENLPARVESTDRRTIFLSVYGRTVTADYLQPTAAYSYS